jgi:iron(III) transport system ATP-binding protein
MTKLSVENLFLDFGSHEILKDVSVVLERGEVLVLLGPSGSGKTTLLRAIAGLELPKRGRIKIDDQVMFDGASKLEVPAEQRNLGFVFQSYGLWPHRTVFDNVAYGLRLRKLPTAEVERRTRKALDELGLGDLSRRYPHQLSGGQQQRVAIARSLVYQPPVILMDEPLSNLDAKLREEAKSWLRGLIVELQLSAVVVTHDQSEAMAMADRIVLLSAGRVEQEGPPEQIYNQPRTLFAAEFFGLNNRLAGRVERVDNGSALLAGPGWRVRGDAREALRPGDPAVGVVRVERARLASAAGDNRLEVTPVTSMFMGDHWQHMFRLGETLVQVKGERRIEGGACWLEVAPGDLWIFKDPAGGAPEGAAPVPERPGVPRAAAAALAQP